jgi:hypothetical protein
MKRCAFLSTDDLTGFVTDDALSLPPLLERGWQVDTLSWRADANWDGYDVVVVRSTWDYQAHADAFDAALQRIDDSAALLCNPLPLMRWNMRKTYLRELEAKGVRIPPTVWGNAPSPGRLLRIPGELGAGEVVIKPAVGANADHAWRFTADAGTGLLEEIAGAYREREFLAQPFIPAVVEEGEFSLVFLAGRFSHTILKTPKAGDFRVQEEHGGIITAVAPEPALLAAAQHALAAAAASPPLYARVDMVRMQDGGFALMELELIEPALYFRMDAASPAMFADAVDTLAVRVPR